MADFTDIYINWPLKAKIAVKPPRLKRRGFPVRISVDFI